MPIFDLFSYRKRVSERDVPDVLIYDTLSQELRVQVIHIWRDAIGPYYIYGRHDFSKVHENNEAWQFIHQTIAREHGIFTLSDAHNIQERCERYFLENASVDSALDVIEVAFIYIDTTGRGFGIPNRQIRGIKQTAESAINELNVRFRRAGVGYQFDQGKLFRVDSELIHSEVVRPALRFLNEPGFEGPRDEFIKAHSHYRAGETKDAITNANNAFESTLKVVCEKRRWSYPRGARAAELLKTVRKHGLLPDYLDNSFDQLAATLHSGLPKVRGEQGAHGQGSKPRQTPDYVAAYALHLAAAKILFVVNAHKAMN